jgi:hypothetical protein
MASQTRQRASEDERRQKVRTVGIATVASATAAIVVSQFWIAGTWMAAALTPVLVTLISELLHKPTTVIASRMTTDRPAVLPEAGGAGRPPRQPDDVLPERAPAEPGSGDAGPVRVYRAGERDRPRRPVRVRRKIAVGAIAATAAIAFAITAIALTGTELITGGSIGKGDHRTTFLGGTKDKKSTDKQDTTTTPAQQDTTGQDQQQQDDQQTTPKQQDTTQRQQTAPTQTQSTTPSQTPQATTPEVP